MSMQNTNIYLSYFQVLLTHSIQSKISSKTKVTEFSFALSVKENVLRLDISMQDSVTVEVMECWHQVTSNLLHSVFWQPSLSRGLWNFMVSINKIIYLMYIQIGTYLLCIDQIAWKVLQEQTQPLRWLHCLSQKHQSSSQCLGASAPSVSCIHISRTWYPCLCGQLWVLAWEPQFLHFVCPCP